MFQSYDTLFGLMEALGKKWVVPLLIFLLFYEKTNFSHMKKQLKITSKDLSKKLKLLEALGLVEKITIERSKKIFYSLSDKGREISQILLKVASNISS